MRVIRIVNGNTFEVRYVTEAEAAYAAWVHERTHGQGCRCGFADLGRVFVIKAESKGGGEGKRS